MDIHRPVPPRVDFFPMAEGDVHRCVEIVSETETGERLDLLDSSLRTLLWIGNSYMQVATKPEGGICGWFCAIGQESLLGDNVMNISIYLTRGIQGKGVGARILMTILSSPDLNKPESRGFTIVTRQNNTAMCKLAERAGFVEALSFVDNPEEGEVVIYFLKGKDRYRTELTETLTTIDDIEASLVRTRMTGEGMKIVAKRFVRDPDYGPNYLSVSVTPGHMREIPTDACDELKAVISESIMDCLLPRVCETYTVLLDVPTNRIIKDVLCDCGGTLVRCLPFSQGCPTKALVFRL